MRTHHVLIGLGWLACTGTACTLFIPAPHLVPEIKAEQCQLFEDPSFDRDYKLAKKLEGYGEAGRQALLYLSRDEEYVSCALDKLTELRDQRVVPLLRRYLQQRGGSHRIPLSNVIHHLVAFRDEASLPSVLPLIRSPEPFVADAAVSFLGTINNDTAREALLQATRAVGAWTIRTVVVSLGNQRSVEGLPWLFQRLETADRSLRVTIIAALARIGTPEAVSRSKEALLHIADVGERGRAGDEVLRGLELIHGWSTDPVERQAIQERIEEFRLLTAVP